MSKTYFPGADEPAEPTAPAAPAAPPPNAAKPVPAPVRERKTGKARGDEPTGGKEQ